MRDYALYLWIGGWLLILPFLGFPGSWKDSLLVLTAVFIIVHSLVGYRRYRLPRAGEPTTEAKEQHTPPVTTETE
ncbi:MAG: hypothetical protein Q7R64_04130 [bacterium]|nr:hypothetical protein [bacterium]